MHQLRSVVEAGDLMPYGHSAADQWRGAATFVDKLLKGATPICGEQPTKFELVIDLRGDLMRAHRQACLSRPAFHKPGGPHCGLSGAQVRCEHQR
jgi:hypothetical protein